ncbi:3516_t:CDS:2, partial [Acaulospora colombiana]
YQHLPNPYPHDAIRDSFLRTNIVNLDLASPPPQRSNPRSHPLTPPDTPGTRKTRTDHELPLSTTIVRKPSLDAFLAAGFVVEDNCPTRYLVVGRVPPETPQMGDLKGIFVRYQNKGIIALSWHDIRDAKKARNLLLTNNFFAMEERLSAAFITPNNLIKATGESPFVDKKEGNLYIVAEQLNESTGHQPVSLHAALALFGELVSFHAKKAVGSTVYIASYYDAREAANAAKALHGRSILGMLVRVVDDPSQEMKQWVSSPPSPTSDTQYPNSDSQTPVPSTVAPTTHPSSHETLYSTSNSTTSTFSDNIEEQNPTST